MEQYYNLFFYMGGRSVVMASGLTYERAHGLQESTSRQTIISRVGLKGLHWTEYRKMRGDIIRCGWEEYLPVKVNAE